MAIIHLQSRRMDAEKALHNKNILWTRGNREPIQTHYSEPQKKFQELKKV